MLRGKTQREVERARESTLDAVEKGEPTPTSRLTLGEYLDRWIESVRVASLHGKPKRQTYRSYEGHVRVHLRPGLGKEPLARLSVDKVQAFFDGKLEAGCSPANMDRVRATLRIALGRAERQKLVSRNVAKLVELSVPDNSRVGKALDPDQVTALLAAAAHERNGPMLAFLVATGLRLGEAQALRWRDVDEKRKRLQVRHTLEQVPSEPWALVEPKSRPSKDRRVPLVSIALEVLRQQRDRQEFERKRAREAWQDNDFVFANEVGDVTAQRGVQDAMKRSLKRAGLETDYRVHDLRHTAGSYLPALGIPLTTVQAIMGHSTLAMTARYAHVQEAMLDDAAERMAAFFCGLQAASS
jgi:integrase